MQNPYLPAQSQAITNQVNQNLQQNQLPGINSSAIAAGGFGGSRQGIAQGLAIGQTNQALGNSLANLNFNAWNQGEQNRMQQQGLDNSFSLGQGNLALGNKQADNSFNLGQQAQNTNQFGAQTQRDLGMGNLALGNKQADNSYNLGLGNLGLGQMQAQQGFYTAQRGQDLQQAGLGANLIQSGNSGLQQGGQGLYNLGLTQQQAPLNALQSYGQMLSPFTGLNNSNTQTTPGASTVGSALGGALTAAQIGQLLSGGK
jgi:hypothetical protein